ncbi:hypothetical protein N7478_012673 [Penicillium angulare]|uniref:uncharacterized protein n=1 Tax=Penicillium angulare TaxID=116970 RepID=UPI002541439D|nr:uncharacterized protein N7478_012673 [Penicillium angulare]KAJ5256569.1 hypothetical protein N7478_012673 [Penicillium angulare]
MARWKYYMCIEKPQAYPTEGPRTQSDTERSSPFNTHSLQRCYGSVWSQKRLSSPEISETVADWRTIRSDAAMAIGPNPPPHTR